MEGGAVGHNFKRDTPRDHLCQVWLHLAKLFQRRRFFLTLANQKKRIILGGHVNRPNGTKWRNFIEDLT